MRASNSQLISVSGVTSECQSTLRHLRKPQHEVRHQSTEQYGTQHGGAIFVIVQTFGTASAQSQRAVHENAGRVNNRKQRGESEQCGAEEAASIIWRDEVQQSSCDGSDVNGKVQPALRKKRKALDGRSNFMWWTHAQGMSARWRSIL